MKDKIHIWTKCSVRKSGLGRERERERDSTVYVPLKEVVVLRYCTWTYIYIYSNKEALDAYIEVTESLIIILPHAPPNHNRIEW